MASTKQRAHNSNYTHTVIKINPASKRTTQSESNGEKKNRKTSGDDTQKAFHTQTLTKWCTGKAIATTWTATVVVAAKAAVTAATNNNNGRFEWMDEKHNKMQCRAIKGKKSGKCAWIEKKETVEHNMKMNTSKKCIQTTCTLSELVFYTFCTHTHIRHLFGDLVYILWTTVQFSACVSVSRSGMEWWLDADQRDG